MKWISRILVGHLLTEEQQLEVSCVYLHRRNYTKFWEGVCRRRRRRQQHLHIQMRRENRGSLITPLPTAPRRVQVGRSSTNRRAISDWIECKSLPFCARFFAACLLADEMIGYSPQRAAIGSDNDSGGVDCGPDNLVAGCGRLVDCGYDSKVARSHAHLSSLSLSAHQADIYEAASLVLRASFY